VRTVPFLAPAEVSPAIVPNVRQRNGGAEDVIGIVAPLGLDEPFGVTAIALRLTVRVAAGKEIWISTRKSHRIKGMTRGQSPLMMPSLLETVRCIGGHGQDLDKHVLVAKPKGRRLRRYSRGRTPELVGEHGTTWGDGSLHRTDEEVDAGAVECGKPAGLHERTLPIDVRGVEYGQRGPI
jgi:hypothetical protein